MKHKWFGKTLVYILTVLLMFSNVAFGTEIEDDLIGGTGEGVTYVVDGDDETVDEEDATGTVIDDDEEVDNNSSGSDDNNSGSDDNNSSSDDNNSGSDDNNSGSDDNNSGSDDNNSGSDDNNSGSDDVNNVIANVLSDEIMLMDSDDNSTTIYIDDAEALSVFMENWNDGDYDDDSYTTISLTGNSYDLSSYSDSWVGIGDSDTPFNLIFDGNDSAIFLPDDAFLFGTVTGGSSSSDSYAQIKNIIIAPGESTGIGGLVDTASYLKISDCTNNGAITQKSSTNSRTTYGSMIANVAGDCTLERCNNYGDVTVTHSSSVSAYVGGLIGQAPSTAAISMDSCLNDGEISVTSIYTTYVGGLIGSTDGNLTLSGCENTASVSAENNYSDTSTGTYTVYTGGLIGYLMNQNNSGNISITNISGSSNSGAVTATNKSTNSSTTMKLYAGGLIGYAYQSYTGSASNISGASNSGAITTTKSSDATATTSEAYAGGLIGYTEYCNLGSGASNTGNVSDSTGATTSYVGGLIGYVKNDLKSYNDTDSALSTTTISTPSNAGAISSNGVIAYVGGLFGYLTKEITLDSATNSGDITVTDCTTEANVGGFVGKATAAATITGTSTNSGDIDVTSDKDAYVGGLLGYATAKFSTATATTTSSNSGNISVTTGSDALYTCVGGLLGYVNYGSDCYYFTNTGDIIANTSGSDINAVGGVTGYLTYDGTSTFEECFNSGTITANESVESNPDAYAGGILGANNTGNAVTITNCGNMGVITAVTYAGGIAGFGNGTFTLTKCFNGENINGDTCAGGLLGYVYNSEISNSYNFGVISADKTDDCYAGGLAGKISTTTTISYSYNTGVVSGYNAAGLVCEISSTGDNTSITYSYNGGYIDGDSTEYGICPSATDVTITNSYYLEQAADTGTATLSGAGTMLTYDQMVCSGSIDSSTIVNLLAGANATWFAGTSIEPAFPELSADDAYSGTNCQTYKDVSTAVIVLDITNKEILEYSPDTNWADSTTNPDGINDTYTDSSVSKYVYIPSGYSEVTAGINYTEVITDAQYSSDQTINLSTIVSASTYAFDETLADDYTSNASYLSIKNGVLTIEYNCFLSPTSTAETLPDNHVAPIDFTVTYTNSDTTGSINFTINVDEVDASDFVVSNVGIAEPWSYDENIALKEVSVAEGSYVEIDDSDWKITYKKSDADNDTDTGFGVVQVYANKNYASNAAISICLDTFPLYLDTGEVELDTGVYTLGNVDNNALYYSREPEEESPAIYYQSGIPFYVNTDNTTYQFGVKGEENTYTNDGGDDT